MKLRFERGALADLDEIFTYIAKDNPEAAAQLVARSEQATALIAEQHAMPNFDGFRLPDHIRSRIERAHHSLRSTWRAAMGRGMKFRRY